MRKGGGLFTILLVALVGFGIWWFLIREEPAEEPEQEETQEEDQDVDNSEGDEQENETEDELESETDFSDYSQETQTVGSEDVEGEFTLAEITDEEGDGYHRFIFTLESDLEEEELPLIEARLFSTGGYVRVLLNQVTSDQSGIDYQDERDISKNGITRLYHDVTANESEEVYNIGILSDTEFYLSSEGLVVTLDIKYPGNGETSDYGDPEEFLSEDVELEQTNEDGDVRISGYTWGVEGGVVKFIWETTSASGNPTPATTVTYGEDQIVVRFSQVTSDILMDDGEFELELTSGVDRVEGELDGDDHVYTFYTDVESEYKIYRELSPNQVVIEIQ